MENLNHWTLPRNMMRFLFADGFLPVANTHVKLVALGRQSTNGRRKAVADATLDWDVEMSDASFRTRGAGQIELDDPALVPGYDQLAREVKEHHPYLSHWDGVPGQPTPEFPGVVNPTLAGDRLYPNIPLTIEINDPDQNPTALSYDIGPGTIVTPWKRPPLASFDQNDFFNPVEYLDYLVMRYSFLSNTRVSDLPITITRQGAPFVELAFVVLQPQFSNGNLKTNNGRLQLEQIMLKVRDLLVRHLRIPHTGSAPDIYLAALRILGSIVAANPMIGPSEGLSRDILDALGTGPAIVSIPSPPEDFATLATLIFYLGAVFYGYRWGTFTKSYQNGWWQLDSIVRVKP